MNELVIGIDILKASVIISFLTRDLNDPVTVSKAGQDVSLVIPQAISKEKDLGRWHIGDDAIQKARIDGDDLVEDLYRGAYRGLDIEIDGRKYTYTELFSTYLQRVIGQTGYSSEDIKKLVITVAEVDERTVELFYSVSSFLALAKNVLTVIDHKESFIFYTLSQNQNVHQSDVALFDCDKEKVISFILSKEAGTRPQVINILADTTSLVHEARDRDFCDFILRVFKDREVSSVFLTGDGFEGDWMSSSIDALCENRRVFLGDNLYSKGACYAGRVRLGRRPWQYIHMGDQEMKMNLSLKVSSDNDMSFYTLCPAGVNWYEASGECEVILDGSPEFECWIQSPETRQAKVTRIELRKMPKRENRTTRLRISAVPVSGDRVRLTVTDLGFGDIASSSGMQWEHMVDLLGDEPNG